MNKPVTSDVPAPRRPGSRRIAWFGGLLIGVIAALSIYDIVRGYYQTIENTGRELDAHARVIAEQTARSFQAIDVQLRHLEQLFNQGILPAMSREDLRAYLKEQAIGLVQIDGLLIINSDGSIKASSYIDPVRESSVRLSAYPYSVVSTTRQTGLYVGNAISSSVDGRWIFPMLRRLETSSGDFAGAVAARGRIDYFEQFYRDIRLDQGTKTTLMQLDGKLLARYPEIESALGKRFPLFDEMLAAHKAGKPLPMRNTSPVDGVERFGSLRLVPDYPLAIIVTRDASVALAPWRGQALRSAARTLGLGVLAALLLVMVMRQLSRLDQTRRLLETSRERFAVAVAGSDDGIWDWDYVSGNFFASARAREILGIPPGLEEQSFTDWFALLEPRLHPDDAPRRKAALEAHLAGNSPAYECEYRVQAPDGGYRWVRSRGMCIRQGAETPRRMAGSISDIDAAKRAAEALAQSEERFALAVAGSNDGILYWDIINDRMYTSERAMQIAGVQAQGTVRTRSEWTALLQIHPDDLQRRTEEFQKHLDGESDMRDSEYRVRHPDGEYRWIRVRGMCVRDAAGRPLRWAGSVSDIDERKRAEEALRQSEERFALAVAGSNDGIVDWDVVNDRMFISERAMQMLGVASDVHAGSADEPSCAMSGMRFCVNSDAAVRSRGEWMNLVRFHPDDVQPMTDGFRWIFEGKSDVRAGECRVLHADGTYRWIGIRGMLVRDASGKPVRWAGSISDIDARKRAEDGLRQSEERFALAVAGSNDGIVDWDVVNDRMYSSERAMSIVGIESNETVRSRAQWRELITYHPEDVPRLQEQLRDFLEGRSELREGEYRVLLANGQYRWIRHRNKCVRDAEGRPIRVAGSVSDIDAQKRVEGQLLQAKKLEAIGTLAGGIAHDFNNILAAILGYGEMAQKDAAPGTALKRHMDAVVNAGMRAKSLVERILAFSRSGVGERKPVHVEAVVTEALDLVAASLPDHVKLERQLAAGDAAVMGDPTQIHQVVMNLCANGAQAMKTSGTLDVALDLVDRPDSIVATSALAAGRYVRMVVRDSGTGIAPNVLERIFDPFYTTKEVGVGTGLGLSLVHGIVTDLGGGINVDSRLGKGTTFTVFLPSSDVQAIQPDGDKDIPNGSGETILLVDDEEALVSLGEEMIAGLGYEPVGFTSSTAALESFRAAPERFHAVLSDESMPNMTGSELAREVHKIRPDIPIVLMSGFVTSALTARAKEFGVIGVLAKPLVEQDIARGLAEALRQGGG